MLELLRFFDIILFFLITNSIQVLFLFKVTLINNEEFNKNKVNNSQRLLPLTI